MSIKKKIGIALGLSIMIFFVLSNIFLVVIYGPDAPALAIGAILNIIFQNNSEYIIFDQDGIPIVNYGFHGLEYVGSQRNPITTSQKLFDYYSDYKETGNPISKQFVINNANWLVSNSKIQGNYSILFTNFTWFTNDMPNPWRSGMAQGQGLQALVKAHKLTNNSTYLVTAESLLNSFFVEVKNGGVTYKSTNAGWWYEEYAHEKGKESRVLNGMMFAVLGIYEYYQYTNDTKAKFLFDKGIEALKHDLSKYDKEGYSYYNVLGKTAPKNYHSVHVNLTKELFDITNEPIFNKYYLKWRTNLDINN